LALYWSWPATPRHEGKSVAQWFRIYCSWSIAEQEDALDTFKALGDQAVPYLISMLSRPHRLSLARSYAKIWSTLPQPLRKVLPAVSTEDTQYRAAEALLRAARPSAKALMPRLHPWLATPEQPRYLLALRLLGYVGE